MPRLSTLLAGAFIAFCFYAGTHQDESASYIEAVKRGFWSSIHMG